MDGTDGTIMRLDAIRVPFTKNMVKWKEKIKGLLYMVLSQILTVSSFEPEAIKAPFGLNATS